MATANITSKLRTGRQLIEWLVLCLSLPSVSFGLIWAALSVLNSSGLVDGKTLTITVFVRPDLVFFATTATVTTLIDIRNTVESFRRQTIYHIIFYGLLIAYGWTIAVYALALGFEILNYFDATAWLDLLLWSSVIPLVITLSFQIFSLGYTTK